ncbi:phosphoenolpyruvate-utilizing N-terminal domain-containing protein, partial [Paenibacillus chitinolyticus]
MLTGIPVSHGISIAPAVRLTHTAPTAQKPVDAPVDVARELVQFDQSIEQTREQLEQLREQTNLQMGPEKAAILSAHLAFLEDPAFVGEMKSLIESQPISAAAAVEQVADQYISLF